MITFNYTTVMLTQQIPTLNDFEQLVIGRHLALLCLIKAKTGWRGGGDVRMLHNLSAECGFGFAVSATNTLDCVMLDHPT